MSQKAVLVLGRGGFRRNAVVAAINRPDVTIYTGKDIEDVKTGFAAPRKEDGTIDHVFIGAGIEIEVRLQIIREILETSSTTTVHLKDKIAGPKGMFPFVKAVLEGLGGYEMRDVLFENTA